MNYGYEESSLKIGDYDLSSYSAGSGDNVLLCLNGGPGLSSEYLRFGHMELASDNLRVVSFDQLGTGRSDRPTDPSLWTIERFAEEVEEVRQKLNLGKIHLAGHSWGGWLALEYASKYSDNLHSLILENTCADIPHLVSELNRLRSALGPETVAMMLRHEAEQNYQHPEYVSAITILNHRHVCRLDEMPAAYANSKSDFNAQLYNTVQGPNEFHYVGNLKDWNRMDTLATLNIPILIVVGQYDEITPACAMRMKEVAKHAEIKVFPHSSHVPFFEEPQLFQETLRWFLTRQSADKIDEDALADGNLGVVA